MKVGFNKGKKYRKYKSIKAILIAKVVWSDGKELSAL